MGRAPDTTTPRDPLRDTQVILLEGREPANRWLLAWSERFEHVRRASHPWPNGLGDLVAVWRNRLAAWFLDETHLPAMLMIDADTVPLPATAELVACDHWVAAARVVGRDGSEAHGRDGEVSCACLRIRREALERIGRPWFAFELRADGMELSACECSAFCARARAAGIHPVHVGQVGHLVEAIALPGAVPGMAPQLVFPAAWPGEGTDRDETRTGMDAGLPAGGDAGHGRPGGLRRGVDEQGLLATPGRHGDPER